MRTLGGQIRLRWVAAWEDRAVLCVVVVGDGIGYTSFGLHVSGGRRIPWPRSGLWKVTEHEEKKKAKGRARLI